MEDERSYFERAADALREAFAATTVGEQAALLEKAIRLNRLAVAEERAKLAQWMREAPGDDGEDG